ISIFEQKKKVIPKKIVINGTMKGIQWDGTKFIFPGVIPLTGRTTDFSYAIDFTISIDTISQSGDTVTMVKDTSIVISYKVFIDEAMKNAPDKFTASYWDRRLSLAYNGTETDQITKNMDGDLELRFSCEKGDAKYQYSTVEVTVTNSLGSKRDEEHFTLMKKSENLFSIPLRHAVSSDSDFKPGDGVVQHYGSDGLILVFRNKENPLLPLDTLQCSVAVSMNNSVFIQGCTYYDRSGDGLIDSLSIGVSGSFVAENSAKIVEHIVLPPFRHFSVLSFSGSAQGIGMNLREENSRANTAVLSGDVLVVTDTVGLPCGDNLVLIPCRIPIADKVAPVILSAACFDTVTKTIVGGTLKSLTRRQLLTVTFSERIAAVNGDNPFLFCKQNDTADFRIECRQNNHGGDVVSFDNVAKDSALHIHKGDSLRINWNGDCAVADLKSNSQNNPDNIRRLIVVEQSEILNEFPAEFDLLPRASLLRFNTRTALSSDFANLAAISAILHPWFDRTGNLYKDMLIITVECDPVENVSPHDTLSATVTLFDALGTVVIREAAMAFERGGKHLVYFWDGRNSGGRKVGQGTYLAVLSIVHSYKDKKFYHSKKVFFGVKTE
ncbi:MAG: hypothetical protein JW795_16335, partial [Chitinivibrionales bacterium]|nr:hypothetical protein [Chitinivibrionales bacterium]